MKNAGEELLKSTHLGDGNIIHMMKNDIKNGNKKEQKRQQFPIILFYLN